VTAGEAPVTFGRVQGFRGRDGEVTIRVASGDAARWERLRRVTLRRPGGEEMESREVAAARAYGDRLVLKFRGIDDASAAERLRGFEVEAPADEVPGLPPGVYWVARLVGARVVEADGREIGRVADVVETGGVDLLRVTGAGGREILVPLARAFVTSIDEASMTIRVSLPEGLYELNAEGADDRTAS
jgi:16S rRNA processing protein RimM